MTNKDRFKILDNFWGYGDVSSNTKIVFVLIEEGGDDEANSEEKADLIVESRKENYLLFKNWGKQNENGSTTSRLRNIAFRILEDEKSLIRTNDPGKDNQMLAKYVLYTNLLPLPNASLKIFDQANVKYYSNYKSRKEYENDYLNNGLWLVRLKMIFKYFDKINANPKFIFMCKSYLRYDQFQEICLEKMRKKSYISQLQYESESITVVDEKLIFSFHPLAKNKGSFLKNI